MNPDKLRAAAPSLLAALQDLLATIHIPDDGLEGDELMAYEQAERAIKQAQT